MAISWISAAPPVRHVNDCPQIQAEACGTLRIGIFQRGLLRLGSAVDLVLALHCHLATVPCALGAAGQKLLTVPSPYFLCHRRNAPVGAVSSWPMEAG